MTHEQLQAVKAALREAAAPMTIAQIRMAVRGRVQLPGEADLRREILEVLAEEPGIYAWPEYGGSPRYWTRPLGQCVEQSLLAALEEGPLTVANAWRAVRKALRYLSERHALNEVRSALPRLASCGRIVRIAINRQSSIYLSRGWIAKLTLSGAAPDGLAAVIPGVVERLESGPGNYVRVDHLRHAPEICRAFDRSIIALADAGRLVLGAYDGPRPVPPEERWIYVEDDHQELFIAVALPRRPEEEV